MHAPQPLQLSVVSVTRPPGRPDRARSGQRATQMMQTTPFAARHRSSSRTTGGRPRPSAGTDPPAGQASVQAPHKVQAPARKSSQATPPAGLSGDSRATIPSGQAATQGPSHGPQVSAESTPASHGSPGPGRVAGRAVRPVRKARREGFAGPVTYSTLVLPTKGGVFAWGTWHWVQTQRAPASASESVVVGSAP